MKTTILIVLSLFAACLLAVPGTWAETKGYIDWRQNDLTKYGVLAAHLLANPNNPGGYGGMAAVYGRAVSDTSHSYGGYFENYGSLGAGLRGDHSGESSGKPLAVYSLTIVLMAWRFELALMRAPGMPMAATSQATAEQAQRSMVRPQRLPTELQMAEAL